MTVRRRVLWSALATLGLGLGTAAGRTAWLTHDRARRTGEADGRAALAPTEVPRSGVAGAVAGATDLQHVAPSQVTLIAVARRVRRGEAYTVSGTGWIPDAPVTLAVVNEERNVATLLRGVANSQGHFSFTHSLSELGTWEHTAHWQPDPAEPPRAPRATTQVVCFD